MEKYRIYIEYIGMVDKLKTIFSPDYTDCTEFYEQVLDVIETEKTDIIFDDEDEAEKFCEEKNVKNNDIRYVYGLEIDNEEIKDDRVEYLKLFTKVINASNEKDDIKNQLKVLINCLMKDKYEMFPLISEAYECEELFEKLDCYQLAVIENCKAMIDRINRNIVETMGYGELSEKVLMFNLDDFEKIVYDWFQDNISTEDFIDISISTIKQGEENVFL